MNRAELSVRKFARGGRAFAPELSVGEPPAPPWFRPRPTALCGESSARRTGKRRAFDRKLGRAPGFRTEISVDHRDFKPKLRRGATETSVHGAAFAPRRPPRERSCGRDGPAAYRSSPERVCPRVVPKGRADRDRNGQTPHARAPAGADVMPVGRVSAAPIARSLCRSGARTTLRARGRLQAAAAGA